MARTPPSSTASGKTALPPADIPVQRASSLRFRLDEDLGDTEWGRLWRATDLETNQPVSLVDLHPDLQHSKRALRAIRDGIQRAESLHGPRLSAVRQLLVVGTRMYLVGDPIPGAPAAALLPPAAIPLLAADLAALLDPVHDAGSLHGNIRAASVFLTPDNRLAALAGFGLPILPRRAFYRSAVPPELSRARWRSDSASDQYALAAALYALLTGALPPSPSRSAPPPIALPAGCPSCFRAAFLRALSPRPASRFASLADFASALAGNRVSRRRKPSEQERRAARRRLLVVLLSLASAALLALLVWGAVRLARRLAEEPPPAPPPPKIDLSLAALPQPVQPLENCPPIATPGSDWVSSDGMEFLWIPAMECWVGRFEVTLGEYRWQNPDHQNKPFRHLPMDDPRQPAVSLNFQEMCGYAAWLTEREAAQGRIPDGWWFRLPTRREAVAFTLAGRDADFPWGAAWPPPTGNFADSAFHQEFPDLPFIPDCRDANPVSAPVEESGENDWGLYGTCGNVWETCVADETAVKFGGWHGGAFDDARPERCGAKSFYGYLGTARGALNGFRLLLVPRPPPPDDAPAAP